MQYLRGSLRT